MRGRKAVEATKERRTVGYVRVSTEEQALTGVSLAAQEARLRAYGLATGRKLHEVVLDEAQSAKSLSRPGLKRILAGVRSGEIGAVIVLKLDRLTRSVRDLADLLEIFDKANAALVSVSESLDTATAGGRLMLNLLASVSQWEREAIAERTAFALAHKRRQGEVYGSTPFGFRRDGDRLVSEPSEQRALKRAQRMHAAGASLRQIARELQRVGATPRRGREWHASSVRALLRSKIREFLAA